MRIRCLVLPATHSCYAQILSVAADTSAQLTFGSDTRLVLAVPSLRA